MVTPARTGVVSDALLVTGADVLWIRDALRQLERQARLNGGGAPARLQALLELVDAVAGPTSAALAASVVPAAESAAWGDVIGTERAGQLLGCTGRYVREQCDAGAFASASKRAGRWTLDEAEVLGVIEERSRVR